ncbi:MAG: Acetylornithine aminotransferase [uncultured Solirubrobacterales bacterium]|uniref:Acetylornithine aminotransferase n=1 Tax=uncultured Solirubrobacterales bacterium TaxID=768556 RepID=A0A6J4TDR4_9ACTN|nr:MAG: Acetylornithine aminotransferase [uncultured Solirubrobacterales bacterium]
MSLSTAASTLAELEALEREALMPTYARLPVAFARGEGTWLYDADGHAYLDFLAGISVAQLGHAHPRLVAAIQEQAARLLHVPNLFYSEPGLRLARRLSACSLGGKVFFANSGAEANECAIKLVRRHRPRGEIVVLEHAFHGRTLGALSATPAPAKQEPFEPLVPGFRVVPREDSVALDEAVGEHTAAVFVEPIQGESGIHPIAADVIAAAREACARSGALLVFDEIQCGTGRTGTLWAYEGLGVRPDVMTVAKGLGGGLPVGACVTTPELGDVFRPGDHGSTFAGGPLVAAAASTVLDVVDDEHFLTEVTAKGERLAAGLRDLGLSDVRGRGLMLAFAHEDAPALMRRLLLEHRLVLNATGPDSVRLLPPLTVSTEEIDEALARLGAALG